VSVSNTMLYLLRGFLITDYNGLLLRIVSGCGLWYVVAKFYTIVSLVVMIVIIYFVRGIAPIQSWISVSTGYGYAHE
jgi:hypothetical protein